MITETIPQFSEYDIHLGLFVDIENIDQLREKVATAPFAMIDATCICTREQLFSAIYKALLEYKYNRLRTKSLNSECILSLSPTSNIGEAFKRFGIKEDTSAVICLALEQKNESNVSEVQKAFDVVQGQEIELTDENLASRYKLEMIKKNYKLNKDVEKLTTGELSQLLVGAIQLRGL